MTETTNTTSASQDGEVQEGADSPSVENPLADEQEVRTEELDASDPRKSETQPKEEPGGSEPPVDSLEALLQEPEPLSFDRAVKHRDIQPGDYEQAPDGSYVIKDKGLYSDFVEIFGDENTKMNLNRFLTIKKAKENKGDAIARIAGFEDGDEMSSMIRKLGRAVAANDQERIASLQDEFPKWIFDYEERLPFKTTIDQKESVRGTTTVKHPQGLPWSNSELDSAVNAYCADKGVAKKELLRQSGLQTKLREFASFEVGGKPISPQQALEYAVKFTENTSPPPPPSGVGGARSASAQPKTEDGESDKDFSEYNQALADIGVSPLSKAAYLEAKKNGIL